MRVLAALIVCAAVVLAGCADRAESDDKTPPPPLEAQIDDPWPSAYHDHICEAYRQLAVVRTAFEDLQVAIWGEEGGRDIASYVYDGQRLEGLPERLELTADDLAEVERQALLLRHEALVGIAMDTQVPSWPPGAELRRELYWAFEVGLVAQQLDLVSKLDDAQGRIDHAMEHFLRQPPGLVPAVTQEYVQLGLLEGFHCP